MAIYVVDTSIVIQYLIDDTYTAQVRVLFSPERLPADKFWMPEFGLLECVNVLWKQVRFAGMPQARAEALAIDALALPLQTAPGDDVLVSALQIGLAYQLAVYDSVYIAMAKRLDCPLITVDKTQAQAATASGVALKPITDFTPSDQENT